MEESSFQAIYTGVYIFVFIAALTTTLYMFRNVNELAENAYNYGEIATNQSVIQAPSEDYKITGEELISYYFNYIKKDKYESDTNEYVQNINLKIDGITNNNLPYRNLLNSISSDREYNIKVTNVNNGIIDVEIYSE